MSWGRLKLKEERRPSTLLVRKRAPPWEVGNQHRPEQEGPRAVCITVQSNSVPWVPAFLPVAASCGREGGPVREDYPSSLCPLPVPGSIYSTMLRTDWLTRAKGGKEREQASLWPLSAGTPQLCFPDKVSPAPGMFFPPLPGPHKTRAVPPNTQKKRKAVAADTLLMTLWPRFG